jgi:hypothetical protein
LTHNNNVVKSGIQPYQQLLQILAAQENQLHVVAGHGGAVLTAAAAAAA